VLPVLTIRWRKREIRVNVFPDKSFALNLTIDDIFTAIAKDNANTSLGNMTEGSFRYLLRSDGRMTTPQQLGNIIVKEINSRPVYISEVAIIEDSYKDITTVSRINGTPSVTMRLKRVTEANAVPIIRCAMKTHSELEDIIRASWKLLSGTTQQHLSGQLSTGQSTTRLWSTICGYCSFLFLLKLSILPSLLA
jgi:multidrug efflux pump subunit AcrB